MFPPTPKTSPPNATRSTPSASSRTASTSTTASPAPPVTGRASLRRWRPAAPATSSWVTKLDRLARSLPDARAIADELTRRQVKLNLGGSVHDPTDPVGRLLFNVLAMVAEFEADLIRARTREGMKVARAKGRLRGKQPKLNPMQEAHLVKLYRAGAHTVSELEELFGITRSTVYRAVRRAGGRASAKASDAAA